MMPAINITPGRIGRPLYAGAILPPASPLIDGITVSMETIMVDIINGN